MTNHEQLIDLISSYALGALSPAENQQVEEHLGECAACQVELRAYQHVVEVLPLAARQRTPPAATKQRLMAQVTQSSSSQHTMPVRGGLSGWFNRLSPALSLASLALVLLLGISNFWLWQRLKEPPQAAEFTLVALSGTEFTPDASGVMIISSDGMEGTLVVENLPNLDEEHQYQLWLIRDGTRSNGGIFSVYKTGYGHMVVKADGSLLDFNAFGITVEPAGGSPGPTGKKVLGGDL